MRTILILATGLLVGYSVREELPIMRLLFGVPAAVALLAHWNLA